MTARKRKRQERERTSSEPITGRSASTEWEFFNYEQPPSEKLSNAMLGYSMPTRSYFSRGNSAIIDNHYFEVTTKDNMDTRQVTFAGGDSNLVEIERKNDQVAVEENYCSIELGILNSSTDDELTRAIFQVQHTLLDYRPLYLQICKNEFAALLLKALGPTKISSSVVNDLFEEVDIDNDGWLSAEELARWMIKIEQGNRIDMYRFFFDKLIHASILGSFVFLCASSLSISKNLFVRFHYEDHVFTSVASELVVWLSLIGSFMFVWSALHTAMVQLRETQSGSYWSRHVSWLLANLMTLSQAINASWVLGSIAYVSEQWLAGGLCYFVGGILAFPSIYRSTLDELVQNEELIRKLLRSFPEVIDHVDEELGVVILQENNTADDTSTGSDLSDGVTKKEDNEEDDESAYDMDEMSHGGMHKRLRSETAIFVKEFLLKDSDPPLNIRHRRAPTCPADLFKGTSFVTCETESLTDTDSSEINDQISTWTSFLGKDIITTPAKLNCKSQLQCYDAFISFSKDEPNLEGSFRVIKRLSMNSEIDMKSIRKMTCEKSSKELKRLAFRQQFHTPSFYISVAYAIGGLMFMIGECRLGFSPSAIQNIYLLGSSLYLVGSVGILYRAWANVGDEWSLLQESRMALHGMTFPNGMDAEPEYELIHELPAIGTFGTSRNELLCKNTIEIARAA